MTLEELKALLRAKAKRLEEIRALKVMTDVEKEERTALFAEITATNTEIRAVEAENKLLADLDTSFTLPPEGNPGSQRGRIEVIDAPIYRTLGAQLKDIVTLGTPNAPDRAGAVKRSAESERRMEERAELDEGMFAEKRAAGDGQITGVDSLGGQFVQTDFASDLMNQGFNNSAVLPKTQSRVLSSGANAITVYGIDETSRAAGSRNGGVVVYTQAELEQYTASKAKFDSIDLKLNKFTGLLYLSDEVLEDAGFLEGEVSELFGAEFAFKIQEQIINGSGAGEFLGVMNSNALVTVDEETSQADDTIVVANISKMKARATGNAEWYANRDTIPQLDGLIRGTGAASRLIFKQTSFSTGILDGIPINFIEQAQTVGDKGDLNLFDFGQYITISKGGVKKASSMDFKFDYGQKAIKWTIRMDGQSRQKSALTPANGSTTTSPFVTLGVRAT